MPVRPRFLPLVATLVVLVFPDVVDMGFIFSDQGLNHDLSLDGSKITRITR